MELCQIKFKQIVNRQLDGRWYIKNTKWFKLDQLYITGYSEIYIFVQTSNHKYSG